MRRPFGTTKQDDYPAPRRYDLESRLCEAIRDKVLVRVLYKDDVAERLLQPYGVYTSTQDKVNLASVQVDNPAEPLARWEPRNLEVGLMRSVVLTDRSFDPDPRFNPSDTRYQNGFVCCIKRV